MSSGVVCEVGVADDSFEVTLVAVEVACGDKNCVFGQEYQIALSEFIGVICVPSILQEA